MFIEILISFVIGLLVGTFTGLTPGIHANLAATLAVAYAVTLDVSPLAVIIGLVTLGVTHSTLDVIPSIFLGAPDPGTVLSVLPGHKMLLKGYGYEAVKMAFVGSLCGILASTLITPVIFIAFAFLDRVVKPYVPYILILCVLHSLYKESDANKRFWAGFIFVMSAFLGITVLGQVRQPLFPLLSGLFGISALLLSLNDQTTFPVQRITDMISLRPLVLVATVGAGCLAGILGAFLPGLGPAHTAAIAALLLGQLTPPRFLTLTGAIGTVNFAVSLVTYCVVGKARNGIVVSMSELLPVLDMSTMVLLLLTAVVACACAVGIGLSVTRVCTHLFARVPYRPVALSVIIFLSVLTVVFSGPIGLLVLIVATAIGVLPGLFGCAHHHAMGCLIVPVILFLLG